MQLSLTVMAGEGAALTHGHGRRCSSHLRSWQKVQLSLTVMAGEGAVGLVRGGKAGAGAVLTVVLQVAQKGARDTPAAAGALMEPLVAGCRCYHV